MKRNLMVTKVVEQVDSRGVVKVEANLDHRTFSIFSDLNFEAKKGEYEVGDRLEITVKKIN